MENLKLIKYPYGKQDPYASIELIAATQTIGSKYKTDQLPVLAARVSHSGSGKTGNDEKADKKLLSYLAKNKHMTPFEAQSATFRVVAPIFVIREWFRHRTASYNESSMRYTSDMVGKMYLPEEWRKQESRNRQSSSGILSENDAVAAFNICTKAYNVTIDAYNDLLDLGVCREQARIVVPVGNYSEFYITANLRNLHSFWVLRSDVTAQLEIRKYSDAMADILRELWPNSWSALEKS